MKLGIKMACHYPELVDSQLDSVLPVRLIDLYPTS